MKDWKDFLWKAAKLWWQVDLITCVIFLLAIAGLVVSFVGFPKELNETASACIYTESGETIPCEIQIRGQVTNYLFRKYADYEVGIYSGERSITNLSYDTKDTEERPYSAIKDARHVAIKDIRQDALVVEMDIRTVFPERESQRCLLVSPVMEPGAALEIVNSLSDPQRYADRFSWVGTE